MLKYEALKEVVMPGRETPTEYGILNSLYRMRADLMKRLDAVDEAIRSLESAAQVPRQRMGVDAEESASRSRVRGVLRPSRIADEARNVLIEAKRPMKRGELVRALEEKGLPLVGKDKNKNLGTILWRNPETFFYIEGLGYWVKGAPLEGVYDPEKG